MEASDAGPRTFPKGPFGPPSVGYRADGVQETSWPANLRHPEAVIGKLRASRFDIAMVAHAYSVLDGYIYGFALTKMSVPFDTATEMDAMALGMFEPYPANDYPNLTEFVTDHVLKPGYDYGDEFEYGLEF